MDKLSECKKLLEQTQQKVTSSVQEWKAFLRFASQIYKYDLTSALLIYAQRPDATALAPIETWNRVGRRVNAGAHGIPTIIKLSECKKQLIMKGRNSIWHQNIV